MFVCTFYALFSVMYAATFPVLIRVFTRLPPGSRRITVNPRDQIATQIALEIDGEMSASPLPLLIFVCLLGFTTKWTTFLRLSLVKCQFPGGIGGFLLTRRDVMVDASLPICNKEPPSGG